jgi:polyhydroxyalkanoate synthesis regulator phasin
VDEEIERRVHTLISRGELAAEEAANLRDKLLSHRRRASGDVWPSEEDLELMLDERGVPTQDDLQQILQQLDLLAAKLDEISPGSGAAQAV